MAGQLARRVWRDAPLQPYLVLALSPALTLPAAWLILAALPDCGADEPWWELRHFELALLPSLADFLPFLWVASREGRVRLAALLAGLAGSARYAVPQALTLAYSASSRGQELNADCTVSSFFAAWLAAIMLALWGASVLVAGALVWRQVRTGRRQPV
jgi:hypothetical protein